MFEKIEADVGSHMEKALGALKSEFSKIRSGRATPALLDTVRVSYYGTMTPLNQMATVSAPEARLILVQPWDQSALPDIEKAIQKSELGLTPQNDGKIIRLPIPPLTEERRKDYVKLINKFAEECRVAIRNARRVGMEELKKLEKDKKLGQDEVKRELDKIQKMTDQFIGQADRAAEGKSKEILEI